ncbi:LysR family transcriptional regulator [Bosea sp. Tri-44]|uniref:LysR family transcriptional regulator n=1 Tax=Bosea sp. Tri-44 TaxID=1972137 RepID=UPI00100DB478|nr:LysR family transcriptional regulator [Bosea sp. Tri-44]RXT51191.1 LysR family transcriptional regulator [Bosea sp. Tri-44]
MDLNQIGYFVNLAETLNFTAAARLSGVSQPSLTRAIQRLEEEFGGPLIYRDGKHSRLTALGHDVYAEFRSVRVALSNVREHAEIATSGRRRVLDIAVAATVGPGTFAAFFHSAIGRLPSVVIQVHALRHGEGSDDVLSGKYHACILPREPRADRKLDVLALFRERLLLACCKDHPLAGRDVVSLDDVAAYPYVDRLACEVRRQVAGHFVTRANVMRPRFRAEREDWVQAMVARTLAVCILPERSVVMPGLVTRPVDGLSIERELVLVTVSGSGTPVEIREIAQMASRYDWT